MVTTLISFANSKSFLIEFSMLEESVVTILECFIILLYLYSSCKLILSLIVTNLPITLSSSNSLLRIFEKVILLILLLAI